MGCALPGWRFLAETELAEGHVGVAREIAENALRLAVSPSVQNHYERFMLTNTLSRCLIASGDTAAAGKMLEAQWPEVVKTGFMPIVAQTATCIAELYKKLAIQTPSEASKKHLVRSVQFFQKAQGMWLDMGNKHQVNLVREATPKI